MLLLVVIAIGGAPPTEPRQAPFSELGGTLGRAPDSTLELPSPERMISRVHARVTFQQGRWFITAVSIAGLSVNGAAVAIGASMPLTVGDVIRIADFSIEVRSTAPESTPLLASPLDRDALSLPSVDAPAPAAGRRPDDFDPFAALDSPATVTHRLPEGFGPVPVPDLQELRGSPSSLDGVVFGSPFQLPPTPPHFEETDDVSLGAAAPASCGCGYWFIAHLAAYPPAQEDSVVRLLRNQSPDSVQLLGKRTCRWAKGTEVEVTLRAEGFDIVQPTQRFTWNARVETLDFRLRATEAAPSGSVLEFAVSIAGFTVAVICLNLRVGQRATDETVQAQVAPARTAFASYASADRPLVMHMVGAIERSAGLEVFLDCLDLKANEAWKPRLEREITARDRFLLFWSRRAQASRWVEWEWRAALRDKGEQALQLHPLEPDLPPPPPLQHLHVSSVHALVAEYYARQSWWRRAWRAMAAPAIRHPGSR